MKISTKRRLLSLLLTLFMLLSLTPTALLEGNTGKLTGMQLSCDNGAFEKKTDDTYELLIDPRDTTGRGGASIKVDLEPKLDQEVQKLHVSWTRDEENAYTDLDASSNMGHSVTIYGISPGETTYTVSAGEGENRISKKVKVIVNGIQLDPKLKDPNSIEVKENGKVQIELGKDYFLFGRADTADKEIEAVVENASAKRNISVSVQGSAVTIYGIEAGEARVQLKVPYTNYYADFRVTVTRNEEEGEIEWTEGCSPSKPLKFSVLERLINEKCQQILGQELASITGLSVPTDQGTLYLGYQSPENAGAGAGSSMAYYYTGNVGPYIRDITFVPKASFTGEKAVISFTGQAANAGASGARIFKGRIEVTLTQEKTDLTVSTKRETPLKLSSSLFSTACQEQVGSPLSYVVFTLPPASQGALYVGYKNEWDYASKVSATRQYTRKQLDDLTFVPAQGFIGTVTVSYAGYSVSGGKYNGQLVIQVKQGVDDAITYNGEGSVSFRRGDFDSFCLNATGRALASVSFTPPPASQGALYLNWNGVGGAAVTAGTSYSPYQIDYLTFVAANDFNGVVRIPFTGSDRSNETFTGTVEIHMESYGGGDISYTCAPGNSVKLVLSDFASLCQSLTGQRLHYITFQTLPDFNQGALYHNRTSSGGMGTRVTTSAKYFNSAAPYISNLSFWAKEGFRGAAEIPFTGCAISGDTFTGILYISSGTGNGSGSANAVAYSVTGGGSVTFSGEDFDDACRQATNSALSYLRLDLPSSGQGILYYDYIPGNTPKALDPSVSLYRSGEVSVDKVTFVPARNFAGVASIPFTGWAIDGTEFRSTVEITVRSAAALGGLVRYETGGAPVRFSAGDIQAAAGEQPTSLRLTGLPSASQGRLYYQYAGPTQYSWEGNTTSEYSLYGDPSVSSLTFVPKAGYSGTVEIPYTASTESGSYSGTIRITVTPPAVSANFDDLSGYSAETKAAVDYLSSIGVVNGTGPRTYEPDASIRRGDFCLMLSRAFRFNVGSSAQGFRDVPANAYYAEAVNELYALGIVNGVGGGRFQPSASLSRQDAALMIQRTLEQAGISTPDGDAAALSAYGDRGQVADYARGAVAGLARLGLLPTSNNRLSPRADLTRADMALLLHRAMTQ